MTDADEIGLMITEDLGDPAVAEYYTNDDLNRDLPPPIPADAAIPRYGYCTECGQVFPPEGQPLPRGTYAEVYDLLLPAFNAHTCPTTPRGRTP